MIRILATIWRIIWKSTTTSHSGIQLLAGWRGLLPLHPPTILFNQTAASPQHDCRAMGTTKAPVEGLYIIALHSRAGHRVYLGRFEYKRSATAHCSHQLRTCIVPCCHRPEQSIFKLLCHKSLTVELEFHGFKRCSRQCTHD